MRHKFRLAQLLKYRRLIEDQKRIALAVIQEKRYREEEKLFRIRESQRVYYEKLQNGRGDTSLHLLSLDALSQESFFQRKILKELNSEILRARGDLLEASKSRKMMERLRDREMERYRQQMLKQERKYLDEVAAIRFARKGSVVNNG